MRIMSFNVRKDNRTLTKAVEFVRASGADIVCLQEFPASELRLLDDVGYYQHCAEESYLHRYNPHKHSDLRLVILSKLPIQRSRIIRHGPYRRRSLRSRLFRKQFSSSFHYVDIMDGRGREMRILNAHLESPTSPIQRMAQFREVLAHTTPNRINLIAGDMNTFSSPIVGLMVFWLYGYNLKHIFTDEPKLFRRLATEAGFQNPLAGKRTVRAVPHQIDYILVPSEIPVIHHEVIAARYGSDHRPVLVEI